MIHTEIREVVLNKLRSSIPGKVLWYDGRPAFLAPEELPAVAVYITDASTTSGVIDEEEWQATLHIEVFLKATSTDSELDKWMESRIYPAMVDIPELAQLIQTMSPGGYEYQRDDEAATWGSADLQYALTYIM
ncbi:phage minor tail U family protein [Raoultella ornithinolytica]|uniref:Phage minor tail U family protein n=1 Tax=Raoultella ornithinolytica TaxID=54291 RepID=A0A9Q9MY71_RAOOR|nr:phage minor tail U family protein [Raoultella ornithinolytica]UXE39624.1 phage minor tail U family protein [Raoultella ornithinolytica]